MQAYQDGAQFYDATTDELIASYPALVRSDYDMEGAAKARDQFCVDHPGYVFEEE